MTITLADIAESEKICETATGGPWDTWPPYYTEGNIKLILHARTQLPKMNKLVREIYQHLCSLVFTCPSCGGAGEVGMYEVGPSGELLGEDKIFKGNKDCSWCGEARRFVERMESDNVD